jgi:hypothetical protein
VANDKDFVVKNGIAITGSIRVNGSSSGTAIISAPSAAGTPTLTLPTTTGTIALLQNNLGSFAATTSSQLAGVISDETGSGALVFASSPTLTTPTLGVASATTINKVTLTAPATGSTLTIADGKTLTASNTLTFTGTDSSSVAFGSGGTVAYTGSTLAQFAATTSLQLAGVISDETGSGALVFGTAPTFTTTIDSGATFGAFASATALTLGYTSTAASTTNISTGAVASATIKAINIGTGGAAGSTTNITLGSSVGGTTAIASPTVTVAGVADTATAATHYYVETATDGAIRPKTLANVKTEIVTTTAVNSAAATTVGTVTSGTWSASFGAVSGANLTSLTAGNLSGTIPSGVLGNSALFIGTTSIALNRTTASQTLTGVSIDGNAATVTNGALTTGTLGQFAATTSSQLAGVISDETGSGSLVFAISPSLTTPTLGVASATTINKVTLTAPATGSTLTIADGKILTVSNTLTFTGTDAASVAFGTGGTVTYTTNKLSVFAATSSAELAGVISDETGSGVLVFGTAPTFTTSIDSGATFGAFASSTALTLGYTGVAASTTNISTGAVASATTKTINLGTGGAASSTTNINIGSASGGTTTVNSGLTVTGNLIVNGTTTTFNSTTVTIDDPIFTLGGDTAPGSDDNKDRGIEFRWHNGSAAKLGFFGFDDSTGYFTFIPDATNTSDVFSGTKGTLDVTAITGSAATWTTARTITLAGDLTGNVSIDGSAGVTLTATIAADSVALGTDTTGNYVASITNGSYITGGNGGSEGAALTLAVDATTTNTASKVVARDASGDFAAGTITAAAVKIDTTYNLDSATATVASLTQTAIASFSSTTYGGGKVTIQAYDSVTGARTMCELLIVHNGTTASATEYAIVNTGASSIATYDVDINTGNVRILATGATTNSTQYKVVQTLILA